jgi:hypothetical protein
VELYYHTPHMSSRRGVKNRDKFTFLYGTTEKRTPNVTLGDQSVNTGREMVFILRMSRNTSIQSIL